MTTLTQPTVQAQDIARPGYFGPFGGQFVPETLMPALNELETAYARFKDDPAFRTQLANLNATFVGRPTPLFEATHLAAHLRQGAAPGYGARIFLKREDLAHTGAHKINNAVGQGLLAQRMGKQRIIAETGAGQHGVAAATVCAMLGLECIVYMGEEDIQRQSLNVFRMKLLGTEVRSVRSGTQTLKDAVNEAIRDWVTNVRDTYYMIGSAIGPHPYPTIVRDFQAIIGEETRTQAMTQIGSLPDYVVACVGGGSNAIGIFYPFAADPATSTKLIGVEAGGRGVDTTAHAATLVAGDIGILHGARMYLLQDADGQIMGTHSISAGLDYPGVGPEHSYYKQTGLAEYVAINDDEAIAAVQLLCRTEGILPALESAHAVAYAQKLAPTLPANKTIVINLSGRGDKDINTLIQTLGVQLSS